MPFRRTLVLVLALLAPAAATAAEPLRVVVRVASEVDEEILGRVRGHASDLPVELVVARGALEEGAARQLDAAGRLGGDVVVWFEPLAGGGVTVHVAEPAEGRLLARRVAADGDGREQRSATAEAAALIVRSALAVLADGGHIGVVARAPATPPPEPPPSPAPRRAGRRFGAAVGWQAAWDGAGQQGLAARVAWERGRLAVGLGATAGLPARTEDERSTVDLARHAAGAHVALALAWPGRWRLEAGLALGVLGYARSTIEVEPGLRATPARLLAAFFVGPEARLALALTARGGVALELTLAADVVLGAPELVYEGGTGEIVVRDAVWPVQPRAALAIVVRTP